MNDIVFNFYCLLRPDNEIILQSLCFYNIAMSYDMRNDDYDTRNSTSTEFWA